MHLSHASVRTWMFAAAASAVLGLSAFAAADVTGTCKLDGKAPEAKAIDMSGVKECNDMHPDPVMDQTIVANESGMLKNVVVAVKKEDSPDLTGDVPKEPAVIDQKGCMYEPHVLAMMTGQDFVVKNSDPFLHNIHTLSQINPSFNKAQPNKNDGEKVDSPKAAEIFHVKCDVHPWMSAYVAVFDHPYFSVSDDGGKFDIKNLPDGDYTLTAWHEKLGTQDQKVSVKGGKADKDIVFTFKPEAAAAPQQDANVRLASDVKKADDSSACPSCCQMDNVGKPAVQKTVASATK
jgi:hypothetical protein